MNTLSVKNQLIEKSYLDYLIYDGQYYYIDRRHNSPFGYEYDLWVDNGPNKLQHRVYNDHIAYKIISYINRKKKLKRILGKMK